MTIQGVFVINLVAVILLFYVLNLVRNGRLYVGYGIIFLISMVTIIITVSIPELLSAVTKLVGAVFPTSALTLIAFSFVAFMFVYILTQLTILSNRLAILVQELAILRAKEDSELLSVK